jgi:hypothetical protein
MKISHRVAVLLLPLTLVLATVHDAGAANSGLQTTLGVYGAPATKGIAAAAAFDQSVGATSTEALDFGSQSNWRDLTGPSWLLAPHSGQAARLEYSLPMMPNGSSYSLAQCASGDYDVHWLELAKNLVTQKLANTVVRPGWEFNGTWYPWSAAGRVGQYIGCFRHIVTTMRQAAGQQFTFDWNVNAGASPFNPQDAYPGDAYVDYVGVDVYDVYWTGYNSAQPTQAQQAAAWKYISRGGYGLQSWSTFAQAHAKKMAFPEWGVSRLSNGKGGGDDPDFIDRMFAFMADPANNVAFAHYFNTGSHILNGGAFPKSLDRYRINAQAFRNRR